MRGVRDGPFHHVRGGIRGTTCAPATIVGAAQPFTQGSPGSHATRPPRHSNGGHRRSGDQRVKFRWRRYSTTDRWNLPKQFVDGSRRRPGAARDTRRRPRDKRPRRTLALGGRAHVARSRGRSRRYAIKHRLENRESSRTRKASFPQSAKCHNNVFCNAHMAANIGSRRDSRSAMDPVEVR